MNRLPIIFLLVAVLFIPVLSCNKLPDDRLTSELELRKELIERSNIETDRIRSLVVDPGEWKAPLDVAIGKLLSREQIEHYNIQYYVVRGAEPGTVTYANGAVIISTGMLDFIDFCIRRYTRDVMLALHGINAYRERYIAAIIAHELGHHENNHFLSLFRKARSAKGLFPESDNGCPAIAYQQECELQADDHARLLLARSGYSPDTLVELLDYMNEHVHQQELAKAGKSVDNIQQFLLNPYLSTHPSPRARIMHYTRSKNNKISLDTDLELAFAAIQFGIDLERAVGVLEKALDVYADNLYLLKAIAVARHKLWMKTVSLENLMLRSIIDSPLFTDDMVYRNVPSTKGAFSVPGSALYYDRARQAYEKVLARAGDPRFVSSYSLLLAYSDDKKDLVRSVSIARAAFAGDASSPFTAANYSTVMFIAGERMGNNAWKHAAITLLENTIRNHYRSLTATGDIGTNGQRKEVEQSMLRTIQERNREYTFSDYTAVLNCALMNAYVHNKERARYFSNLYRRNCEKTSDWALFLFRHTGLEPGAAGSRITVKGVGVGDNKNSIVRSWGDDSITRTLNTDSFIEVISCRNGAVKFYVRKDVVKRIVVEARDVVLSNSVRAGMPRGDIERLIDGPVRKEGIYCVYYVGCTGVAVRYEAGRAAAIELF